MTSTEEDFKVFFENSVVAVGWSNVDFTKFASSENLVAEVECEYYTNSETAPQVAGKKKNEVRRFKGIRKGDRIVIPCWGAVYLAIAEVDEIYNIDACKNDLANQHKVQYCCNYQGERIYISRDKLSERLQRRLRVRGTTIANLNEFADEIEALFRGEDFNATYDKEKLRYIEEFKKELLLNIQTGKTSLEAGGYGLEKLVKELLEIDGYNAEIQSKQRFSGFADADIIAIKDDFLITEELLIQIKHHSGITDTWGAHQLSKILETEKDLFAEFKLVLITSGDSSDNLREYCESKDIILIEGKTLIEWLYNSLHKLSPETMRKLSICDIPTLIGH
ncbi:MAG: restriction endonuclease [Candidatus Hatepunaea meridiana]|nr:restriction endonuclease [Candidatus Hatepunaea meridiana]